MFRRSTLATPGRHSRDISLEALLISSISTRGKLDQGMERNLHPRALLLGSIEEISVNAAQNSLVSNDDDVFAALKFHDNRLKADYNIAVRLSATVAVVVLVFVASCKVLRVFVCNFFVGEAIAHTRVKFIQGFPLKFLKSGLCGKVASGLNGAFEGRGPDDDLGIRGDSRFLEEARKSLCVSLTSF